MFTPQQIEEQTFAKAVFGGYDMQQVDDFLEPLTQDYIALYKENEVLKSKMKFLVEKLEELRAQQPDPSQQATAETKAACDRMLADTKKKCDEMLKKASADRGVADETERLNYAKQTAQNFIEVLEHDIRGHLELLEKLKTMDLTQEKVEQPAREKPYDWQEHEAPAPSQTTEQIASEISENLGKLVGTKPVEAEEPPVLPEPDLEQAPHHPESATIKFTDLKFGRNYDPTTPTKK